MITDGGEQLSCTPGEKSEIEGNVQLDSTGEKKNEEQMSGGEQ